MKTHLPKGLRAALMAALASVSLTAAYGATPIPEKTDYSFDWSKVKPARTSTIQGVNCGGIVFSPTVPASSSTSSWYAPSTNSKYTGYTGTNLKYINVVRSETTMALSDVYFDMEGVNADYGISGLAGAIQKTANIYVRVGQSDDDHNVTFAWGAEAGSLLRGNVYMELNDSNATYTGSVAGANISSIMGSSTSVIRDGKFSGEVVAGIRNVTVTTGSATYSIDNGTYLQIEGGTFDGLVVAGNKIDNGKATINNGTHLLIKGGTFNSEIIGGCNTEYLAASTITGGVSMRIEDGTFKGIIYGGNTHIDDKIAGGINMAIMGGTFLNENGRKGIYALGYRGTVTGNVELTIDGKASFANNYTISAGSSDNGVDYNSGVSKVTLKDIASSTSSLASDSTITVDGGDQISILVMNNVDTTINAKLTNFKTMQVTNSSDLTLSQATNADLGGVSSVTIDSGSILTLQNNARQTWDLSGKTISGTLAKTGAGTLRLSSSPLTGNLNISEGLVEVSVAKTFKLNGNTISLSGSGSFKGDGITYSALEGKTGTITSTSDYLDLYVKGKGTTLKDVALSEVGGWALRADLDNVSLTNPNTRNYDIWLIESGSTKKLVDVTTHTTLNVGAGNYGDGDTINATISGTANVGGLAIGNNSTLKVLEGGKLHVGKAIDTADVTKLQMASGSTLSVKEGDLFASGAGTFSISGVTLEANEGNWTLNKKATVNGVTITGEHAVCLGSEVDSTAVVTMSGTIDSTGGHLVVKNGATTGETALTGHFTIENTIQNGGALTIADGSYIGINEESLKNCIFLDDEGKRFTDGANGFLHGKTVVLASGGTITCNSENQHLRFDGANDTQLTLSVVGDKLLMGIAGEAEADYFVNVGTKSYSDIVAHAAGKTMNSIALDGGKLILNSTLAPAVKILAATDHASVSVDAGIELYAGQTEIVAEGSVNELHVTGEGSVRIDAASAGKLSQLAGDATMKVDTDTTFSSEAKMTGALEVSVKEGASSTTLTVSEAGKIASFKSVDLADNTTLKSQVADTDSIQALNGSGTLSKTGEGKLAVKDASGFTGDINAMQGTLELEGVALATAKERKVSVSGGATVNIIDVAQGADVVLKELVIDGGTFGVYQGGTAEPGAGDANVGNLTLAEGGTLTICQAGGMLEANLTTESGSTLDFTAGGVLTMGCDLNVGDGTTIVISGDAYASLMDGKDITLFEGVDNKFCLDVTGYVICPTAAASAGGADSTKVYLQTGEGGVAMLSTTANTPEPTTGTLSLLALAGLCARRRRK